MKGDSHRWKEELGVRTLRDIGIAESQNVLDFGCGEGWYTIPAAKIVGSEGIILALDQDRSELDKLSESLQSEGIENCRLLFSDDMHIDLPDDHVDVVLLFDVLHHYYFSERNDRVRLLRELRRVLKPDGMLALYPKHLETHSTPSMREAQDEFREEGFHLAERKSVTMIHEEILEEATVMKYRFDHRA